MNWGQWWPVLLGVVVILSIHVGTTAVVRWGDDRRVRDPLGPRCLTNDHDLTVVDVIPFVSFARSRGACRTCGVRIPWSLLFVEVAVPVVMVAVTVANPGVVLVLLLPIAWSAVVATPIDLAHRIIPNRLTHPLALYAVVAATVLALIQGDWGAWRRALLVGLVVPVAMLAMSLLFELLRGQAGIGMGDIKWAASLGVAFGWLGVAEVVVWLYGTVIAAGVVGLVLLLTGRAKEGARIPYGPYLALGSVLALVTGDRILVAMLG